jgi:CRISPR-associated protein Cmr6
MYPYSGLKLIELLEKQHQARASQKDLFKTETFNLLWRTKRLFVNDY